LGKSGAATITSRTFFHKKDSHDAQQWELAIYSTTGAVPRWSGKNHLRLYHWMVNSAAYCALSNNAKVVLWELMRRHDDTNNGSISFGGKDGRHAQLSRDVTERALDELERAGFIVETAPAVARLKHPRKWRLTMYRSEARPATKDFMRSPAPAENSFHGELCADDPPDVVNCMRTMISPSALAPCDTLTENSSSAAGLEHESPPSDHPRTVHREAPDHPRPVHTSIEAMSEASPLQLSAGASVGNSMASSGPAGQMELFRSDVDLPLKPSEKAIRRQRLQAGYDDAMEIAPPRTRERIAAALDISPAHLSNWRSGRDRLRADREAELSRLIESGAWRDLPAAVGATA
jgi:hypothetical protein